MRKTRRTPGAPDAPPAEGGAITRTTVTETVHPPQPPIPPEPEPEPEQDSGLPEDLLPEPIPDEIGQLLNELGDTVHKVVVYRYNRQTKKNARLDEWPHTEFSLGMLADTYGGGTYRIYVFRPNGQMVSSKMIDIDEAKKPKADVPVPMQAPAAPQVVLPDNTKMMELIMNQANQSQALMMTMMTKLAEVVAAAGNRPAQPSVIKDVGDILALQKMLGSDKDPAASRVDAVLNGLRQGLELGQSMGSGNEDKGFLDKLMDNLLPALAGKPGLADQIVSLMRPPAPRPLPGAPAPASRPAQLPPPVQAAEPVPAAPAPELLAPAPAAAPAKEEESSMGFGMNLILAMYKGPVLDMARNNHDPEMTAEIILLRIPQDYHAIVLDFVSKPDRMNQVLAFLPELSPHAEWTNKVLDAGQAMLREEFTPEGGEPPQELGAAPEAVPAQPGTEEKK